MSEQLELHNLLSSSVSFALLNLRPLNTPLHKDLGASSTFVLAVCSSWQSLGNTTKRYLGEFWHN